MASSGGSCSQFQTQTSSSTEGSSSQAEGAVPHVEWDWCNDRLVWTPYSPVASSIIESVFQSGRPSVELAFRGESYSIVFEKSEIVQRNLASSRVRHVKREAMDGTPVSWLWSSKHGWNSYNSELSQNIEKAWQESNRSKKIGSRNGPAGYSFTIHMQAYLIEFEGDGTQYNTTTNYSRRVRRRLSLGNSNMQDGGETTSNHLRIAWSLTCDESCDSLAQSHYSRHMVDLADPPMTEDCAICLSGLHERPGAVKLSRCKHLYHRDCILTWFKNRPTCPKCSRICGIITGNQPCGEMHVQYLPFQVGKWEIAGYPNTDVIKITYGFPSGIQVFSYLLHVMPVYESSPVFPSSKDLICKCPTTNTFHLWWKPQTLGETYWHASHVSEIAFLDMLLTSCVFITSICMGNA
ncbi:hypothetical protein KP509_09G068000 [Ceratopteris richardii]|uniref:RING-type E3 ubiquitin transferase n=1 Tax=Ceratopteris richardii TaxID=49495 RepID=A0A8T2U175_CERRI|nr:hypothetical protein KP509_09G068000 [Ceratopteris richardii]KAH7429831.1 hypothetical protein KP509_09G068000 [Ceratopteris richardii]KAH7429832.1 hypothetical protein KP509_09G068000 [Ceratopteris richardii]